ncbi:MAG: general secretion pathway protein [Pirellulaceae bacterium]|nr:general secretion pathway protein [Pirellulaceae bacterium]
MCSSWIHRRCTLALLLLAVVAADSSGQEAPIEAPIIPPGFLTEPESAEPQAATNKLPAGQIRFSFEATPWREVINWLAEESNLALHIGDLPTGSFTYSDPNAFTHAEAIDRINLFMLPQGFTLVRSGRLLTVINLSDPRSMQQLDTIADLVTVDELAKRSNYDVVKCIFPLGELDAEDAVNELSALKLMTTPAVFSKTNQLMITDTAGKLKNVKAVLDAFRPDELDNGTIVRNFALQHVQAEDILLVARPHMGLATGEMIGIDVSLSADLEGKNIFITGVEDKVKLLESLITALDQPQKTMVNSGENELKAHAVQGGNVETVYNVLLTLLANKEVRLSMDEEAGSIVALATPSVQAEIAETVRQLQASEADFEVIPLKTADPYFVISLLEEMLDLPDALDDPDDIDPDAPKIDADPGNMRLFVRAKAAQIEQIKKIVEGLDSSVGGDGSESDIRVLPIKGKEAERLLDTASKFWKGGNPIILYRSADSNEPIATERVLNADDGPPKRQLTATQLTALDMRNQRVLTTNASSSQPAIRCQVTARGLLIQSEDTDALDQFEDHLITIAGPVDSAPSPPIVFYLKYTKPADAIRMLAELMDGGEAAREGEAGTLVNGYVSASSSTGFTTSFVTNRDGTITLMSGSVTVVADGRLNRLIAQGTPSEIDQIEAYLKIIDKDNSITAIETHGTSHVIELVNTKASEVAAVIRDAYAGRVASGTGAAPPQAGKGGSADQQREAAAAAAKAAADAKAQAASKKGADKKAPAKPATDSEPKMTIAVHEPSNSLIVTAPEQLFLEVEKLARLVDARGEQAIEVITPLNGEVFEAVLQQVLLGQEPSRSPSRSASTSRSPTTSRPSAATYSRSKGD